MRSAWLFFVLVLATPSWASAQYGGADVGEDEPVAFRLGGDIGFATLELENYLVLDVTGLLRVYDVRLDFEVPLRFNDQGFRTADYDDPRDFARVVRCVRVDVGDYTHPEDVYDPTCTPYRWAGHGYHDRLYFSARVSPLRGVTLGNGSLVYNYRNSLDLERPQLGTHMNFQLYDYGDAEVVLDDITRPGFMAARVSFRPPQVFLQENWDETDNDFEIGLTVASDVNAPLHRVTAFGRGLLDENGDARFLRSHLTALSVDAHWMQFWGLGDREAPQIGLFMFADYNHFLEIADANALHAGARFVLRHIPTGWELRIGAEYRLIGGRYLPELFDADYNIQSQRFALTQDALALPNVGIHTTLLEFMQSRQGGFDHGFQAFLSVVFPIPSGGQRPNPLPLFLFVEESTGPVGATVSAVLGPFQMDQLVAMAMYQRRNFEGLENMFSLDGTLIRVLGRLFLGSQNPQPGSWDEIGRFFHIDLRFDRRYFQTPQGDFNETNDFVLQVGFSGGA